MRLLIIEDDLLLGDSLELALQKSGYAVDWAKNASEALAFLASTSHYSAVLLDLNLPDLYGIELLAKIRADKNRVPVLVITALDNTETKILGLDSGADDYIVKPFDIEELLARIRSVVRRSRNKPDVLLEFSGICLNPATHTVTLNGTEVQLMSREYMLLKLLMDHEGRFVSKELIMESIYSWRDDVGSNAIEVHISNLRKKVGKERIKMLRNVGYRLERVRQ